MFRVTVVVAAILALSSAEFSAELHEKFQQMPRKEFIEYFNKLNYSWTINDYDFEIPHCNCSVSGGDLPVLRHDIAKVKDVPESFDAREKWSQCQTIQTVYNQGHCGSCWTFGTATTASDRTCIHKDVHVELSEEDFECMQQDVCGGGDPTKAFQYWQDSGLVTTACKPYDTDELKQNVCTKQCVDSSIVYANDKHFAASFHQVDGDEANIKTELFKNGPIQASFMVYEDLRQYKAGVYVHSFGKKLNGHSVRVIGYGVENDLKYWLVANSWGTGWGENGLFKVQAFQPDLEFESGLLSGIPKN